MDPNTAYSDRICRLYGDLYDDREEDSRIGGDSWEPGKKSIHKSIRRFQMELEEIYGIRLSRTKIQKILITGARWTTERSREIGRLFEEYTHGEASGKKGMRSKMSPREAILAIAAHLGISTVSVSINLPYQKGVYELDEKSENAKRIKKLREKRINQLVLSQRKGDL